MKKQRIVITGFGIAVALIGFIGFSIRAQEQSRSNEPAATVRGSSESVFPLLGGGTLSLSDYRGKKPVILDFFATWCPNCQRNTPHLNELYKKYKDQIEIIGVNFHEDPTAVKRFVDAHGITFPVALDESGSFANQFEIRYTNTHVFIGVNGAVLRVVPGDVSERDIQVLLNS